MGEQRRETIRFRVSMMHTPLLAGLKASIWGKPDDAELVRAAKDDPEAFAPLYRRYVTPIYRYCYSRVGDAVHAEDVTAQVFTAALAALPNYDERGTFGAWLFTIARHKCASHHRRSRPTLPWDEMIDSPLEGDDPLAQVVHGESLQRLADLVGELGEDQQELLRLRYAVGLTYAQIGQVVGRSEAAAKMAMHRLLRRLQAAWEEMDE